MSLIPKSTPEPLPSRGAFIAAAREQYARGSSDNIEIDDNAILSEGDDAAFVMAWVHVDAKRAQAYEGSTEALEANAVMPLLGHADQQQLIAALDAARSVLADSGCELAVMQQIDAALTAAGRP